MTQRINLLDFDRQKMIAFFDEIGEKKFRAQQVLQWIHQFGICDFSQMTNLSKVLRDRLMSLCEIRLPEVVSYQHSVDGTRKWLIKLDCGNCIETVFIPEKNRGTLCVSSQVGCGLNCSFCSTAKQGFNRDLTVSEIIAQVWLAVRELSGKRGSRIKKHCRQSSLQQGMNERGQQVSVTAETAASDTQYTTHDDKTLSADEGWHGSTTDNPNARSITNVVMMGMGEPLLNFDNVVAAMDIMMDDLAYGLSKYRVTLSTSGLIPEMYHLKAISPVSLAVSLHAPNDALRNELVPINKKYPLEQLMQVCRSYFGNDSKRQVTFEYVMLKDVNDKPEHAKQLIKLLHNVPAKVNLIPFNPFPLTQYERSLPETIVQFRELLVAKGINTITRKTRGEDIDAACGQLAGKVNDRTSRSTRWQKLHFVPADSSL